MSVDYYLYCVDCGYHMLLGCAISVKYKNVEPKTYGFNHLADYPDENGHWQASQKNMEILQHFLMLHRNHEIRVFSDKIPIPDNPFPMDDNDIDPAYDRLLFLAKDTGRPDPDMESKNTSKSLLEKIKSQQQIM